MKNMCSCMLSSTADKILATVDMNSTWRCTCCSLYSSTVKGQPGFVPQPNKHRTGRWQELPPFSALSLTYNIHYNRGGIKRCFSGVCICVGCRVACLQMSPAGNKIHAVIVTTGGSPSHKSKGFQSYLSQPEKQFRLPVSLSSSSCFALSHLCSII